MCKRVQQRIECLTCGYPYSEAIEPLTPDNDPGCEVEEAMGLEPDYSPIDWQCHYIPV